jgi:hypothetical protein
MKDSNKNDDVGSGLVATLYKKYISIIEYGASDFNTSARRAFYRNQFGTFVTIKSPKGIIKAFYRKCGTKVPIWVTKVTLLKSRIGIKIAK